MDHPRERYPVGSLVTLESSIEFVDASTSTRIPSHVKGTPFLIMGYVQMFSTGARDQRDKWNVMGLLSDQRVVSLRRFDAGDLLKVFTMVSDVRDGVES